MEDATYSKKLAQKFVKQMRLQGQFTAHQILQLSPTARLKLRNNRISKLWEDTKMQQSLLQLDFKLMEDPQNCTPPTAVTGKRDIATVIQQANDSINWKQTTLPQLSVAGIVASLYPPIVWLFYFSI